MRRDHHRFPATRLIGAVSEHTSELKDSFNRAHSRSSFSGPTRKLPDLAWAVNVATAKCCRAISSTAVEIQGSPPRETDAVHDTTVDSTDGFGTASSYPYHLPIEGSYPYQKRRRRDVVGLTAVTGRGNTPTRLSHCEIQGDRQG